MNKNSASLLGIDLTKNLNEWKHYYSHGGGGGNPENACSLLTGFLPLVGQMFSLNQHFVVNVVRLWLLLSDVIFVVVGYMLVTCMLYCKASLFQSMLVFFIT